MSKQMVQQYIITAKPEESQLICSNKAINFIRIYAIPGTLFNITSATFDKYNIIMNNSGIFEMRMPNSASITSIQYINAPNNQQIIVDCIEEVVEEFIEGEVLLW